MGYTKGDLGHFHNEFRDPHTDALVDPDTVTLNRLHQGPNISVTGKQHDFIEVPGHFKNVHRDFGT